jgi:hypothetical protein
VKDATNQLRRTFATDPVRDPLPLQTMGGATLMKVYEGQPDGVFDEWAVITRGNDSDAGPEDYNDTGFAARIVRGQGEVDGQGASLQEIGTDITVYPDMLHGVLFTGDFFQAVKSGRFWFAVSPGEHIWTEAVCLNFIGQQYKLWDDGPTVTATSNEDIANGTTCLIVFDTRLQEFKVIAQFCPTDPYPAS